VLALTVALLAGAGACATHAAPPAQRPAPGTTTPAVATPSSTPPSAGSEPPARFQGSITQVDATERARMLASGVWRAGCPVPIDRLRLLRLSYWGFDGAVRQGTLMVHADVAASVLTVMRRLFAARFPIQRMVLMDRYGGDDDRSMAANNTSAFNCRPVAGTGRWSQHAYGRAVDVNPVQNPQVHGQVVSPPAGHSYLDRTLRTKGMIHPGDLVVRAFAEVGWRWGGDWRSLKDYQHFSANGR